MEIGVGPARWHSVSDFGSRVMAGKGFISFGLAAAALVMPTPSLSQSRNWSTSQFEIAETETGCGLTEAFVADGRPDTRLVVLYDGERVDILLRNAAWTSRDGVEYPVEWRFGVGQPYYAGNAYGLARQGDGPGLVASFNADVLTTFAAAPSMSIRMGETVVASLNLAGSRTAVARLRQCTASVLARNAEQRRRERRFDHIARDPFASVAPTTPAAVLGSSPRRIGSAGRMMGLLRVITRLARWRMRSRARHGFPAP